MKKMIMKRKLGERYCFQKFLSDRDLGPCLMAEKHDDPVCAASLTIGCVKLELCRYPDDEPGSITLDLLVKDEPKSPEWISFDSIRQECSKYIRSMETEMFNLLDREVRENNLYYTECNFERIEGIDLEKKSK